jgi:hypothetical protein
VQGKESYPTPVVESRTFQVKRFMAGQKIASLNLPKGETCKVNLTTSGVYFIQANVLCNIVVKAL